MPDTTELCEGSPRAAAFTDCPEPAGASEVCIPLKRQPRALGLDRSGCEAKKPGGALDPGGAGGRACRPRPARTGDPRMSAIMRPEPPQRRVSSALVTSTQVQPVSLKTRWSAA